MKITILVEGKTETAFKPQLLEFLKNRLAGAMPKLDFFPCDGRIYKDAKLRRTVDDLLQKGRVPSDAVIALTDSDSAVTICAHLSLKSGDKLSLISLKKFCSERLPLYMVPDKFKFHTRLPKTSTDKVDYQRLKAIA